MIFSSFARFRNRIVSSAFARNDCGLGRGGSGAAGGGAATGDGISAGGVWIDAGVCGSIAVAVGAGSGEDSRVEGVSVGTGDVSCGSRTGSLIGVDSCAGFGCMWSSGISLEGR